MDKPFTEPCVTKREEEVKDIDCRPSAKVKLLKIISQVDKDRTDKKKASKAEDELQETRILPWRSEYQDTVSKLGNEVNARMFKNLEVARETQSACMQHGRQTIYVGQTNNTPRQILCDNA
ncbi:hypothetical protein K0M31_000550 [Melipona bicolor]|uniref:Uncharacterized protein n=1 Tax=Melipona bicolor TaxID=60889 RepID=A0AA40KWY1_9HYME|nr:hypothetical protein K0M31_000550 [Melipona bicolor]